jgi:hypothetical protein
MPRLPYAAKQFITEADPSTAVENVEESIDGFGVYRTIRFGKRDSKRIGEALLFIEDERIEDWHVTEAGYLYVDFSPGPDADVKDPFYLKDAEVVARGSDSEPQSGNGEGDSEGGGS